MTGWLRSRIARRTEMVGARPPGLLSWWYRRADRRIVARGGAIPGADAVTEHLPPAEPFVPTEVNADTVTQLIVQRAAGMLPGGVDEMTGHVLDNLINSRVDQWRARVLKEHAVYLAAARYREREAMATLKQQAVLLKQTERRLLETEIALNAAVSRLLGKASANEAAGRRERRRSGRLLRLWTRGTGLGGRGRGRGAPARSVAATGGEHNV
ncbi:hypothetical protein [Actinomadura latina]|uniref:Uncharacterized protein n=1 Tax=Actinomadura latina TaxID=163603 RepID=A0A846YXP4_9ACTN|nr:hypothetical protein [Actinomadura latina]NKZ05269.1 hypothetical protein [Actinomadura latina]